MSLAERIRLLREEKGLSINELARRSDTTSGNISKLERNIIKNPSLDTIAKIASGLGVNVNLLIDSENNFDNNEIINQIVINKYKKELKVIKEKVNEISKILNDITD